MLGHNRLSSPGDVDVPPLFSSIGYRYVVGQDTGYWSI